jgi:hypothetical protein
MNVPTSSVLTGVAQLTTSDLVAFYNQHNKKSPVKKFADRATAEKRCLALAQSIDAAAKESAKLASAGPVVKTTKAGATVTIRPAAGAPALPTKSPKAAVKSGGADTKLYRLGDTGKVKRGSIFDAISALTKKGVDFTRPDFCKACGGEVNALSHFYWARRHGVVLVA